MGLLVKKGVDRRQALAIARYMGCRGAHKDGDGGWMPCADHETLMRLSTAAEDDSWLKRYDKKEYHPAIDLETKSNYTKPKLRESIKKRIMAGSRGGKPGQWSARKAQLVALEYRKAGGGYKGKKTKKQRSLKKWTSEKWTTSDGKPAIRPGGTRRYLPAKAWSKLTPAQRAATNRKKISGSKRGRQFVANTEAAARARKTTVKTHTPIIVTKSLIMQRFEEQERRSPRKRKVRGRRWETLDQRGPVGITATPNLGITSSPITMKLMDASDEVKQMLNASRKLIN